MMDQEDPNTIDDMKDWLRQHLSDRDPRDHVSVDGMSDEMVLSSIDYAYPGGSSSWGSSGSSSSGSDDDSSWAPYGQWT